MQAITGELKEKWDKSLRGILSHFISICQEQHLTYYLAYGSALGALRHGGIIPWDDDIDVVMPRPDYNRLIDYCLSHPHEQYRLLRPEDDVNYFVPFIKLIDSHTQLREHDRSRITIGIFLDIFPIDGGPDNKEEYQQLKTSLVLRHYYMFHDASYNLGLAHACKMLMRGKVKFFLRALAIAVNRRWCRDHAYRKIHAMSERFPYETSRYICNWNLFAVIPEHIPRDVYGEGRTVQFEGIEVVVPSRCEEYLECIYGDWRQPPPPSERGTNHLVSFIHFDD